VLPGLMSLNNTLSDPLALLRSMSALVLTSYFRPLASKTYWFESKRVCGWLPILVTVTCRIVHLPCAVSPKPSTPE
jgi:hypothetical protein